MLSTVRCSTCKASLTLLISKNVNGNENNHGLVLLIVSKHDKTQLGIATK